MKYDYQVEKMPKFKYPAAHDKDEKHKRIWQVVLIERDDMGSPVKEVHVERANMTYDEATSAWNELVQALRKAGKKKDKK